MKDFKRCDICNDYHWDDENCKPIYEVYHEDYLGDESKTIRAMSHEDAAQTYARYYNEDYSLMNENIEVKVEKDGVTKFFCVGAEPDIHYSSEEIDSITAG